jgi:hypothetical protein
LRGAEALPAVGRTAEALAARTPTAAAARRILGTTGYGALMSPEQERLGGAYRGLGLSTALEALPGGLGRAAAGIGRLRPQQYANEIMNYYKNIKPALEESHGTMKNDINNLLSSLGKGEGLTKSGKTLTKKIRTNYQIKEALGKQMYEPVMEQAGDWNIYSSPRGFLPNNYKKAVDPEMEDAINAIPSLKKLHQKFKGTNNFSDAHTLQSQLGSEYRSLKRQDITKGLSIADKNKMINIGNARKILKNDIDNFLQHNDYTGDLANQYDLATRNWRTNVMPYAENPKILPLAKGKIENPRAIAEIFKHPEAATEKVVNDLGDEGRHRIIYSALKNVNREDPASLLRTLNKLDDKGLADYITPDIYKNISRLTDSMENLNKLKSLNQEIEKVKVASPENVLKMLNRLENKDATSVFPDLQEQLKTLSNRIKWRQLSHIVGGTGVGTLLGIPLRRYIPPGISEAIGGLAGGLGAPPLLRTINGHLQAIGGVGREMAERPWWLPTIPQTYRAIEPGILSQVRTPSPENQQEY